MNRSACPACSCGFSQDPTLFPALTNTRVQAALSRINSAGDLYNFLQREGISLGDKDGEWIFPSGVCMKIRDKLLIKMKQLAIGSPKKNLFSSHQLLPAVGPDDEGDMPIGSGGATLSWDDDPFIPSKAWGPNPEQLRLDE